MGNCMNAGAKLSILSKIDEILLFKGFSPLFP
jgi:hypothetical protein